MTAPPCWTATELPDGHCTSWPDMDTPVKVHHDYSFESHLKILHLVSVTQRGHIHSIFVKCAQGTSIRIAHLITVFAGQKGFLNHLP